MRLNAPIDSALLTLFVSKLARIENLTILDSTSPNPTECISDVGEMTQSFVELSGIDVSAIITRLTSQELKLQKEITKLSTMLENPNFVKNAPAQVLEQNRSALTNAKDKLQKVQNELHTLQRS